MYLSFVLETLGACVKVLGSRYLGLCRNSWDCAETLGDCVGILGIVLGHLGIVLGYLEIVCTVVFGTVNCTRIHETCVRVLGVCKTIVTS